MLQLLQLFMERLPKKEKISLVEKQKQEAMQNVVEVLLSRFPKDLKKTFESHGKEYVLTSAEDCMVAFAEQNREVVEKMYEEIKEKSDYRSEQAIAKLFALFLAYEKMIALQAELRSYYPQVAEQIEEKLPSLSCISLHGDKLWNNLK